MLTLLMQLLSKLTLFLVVVKYELQIHVHEYRIQDTRQLALKQST